MALFKKTRSDEDLSDASKLLVVDHRKVDRLLAEIAEAQSPVQRQGLVGQLDAELTRHMRMEETVVYPFIRDHIEGGSDLTGEAEEEHTQAKEALRQVTTLDVSSDAFSDALKELTKLVKHHVTEEEKEVLPKLDDETDDHQLAILRGELERVRMQSTPTPELPSDQVSGTAKSRVSSGSSSGTKRSRAGSSSSRQLSHVWVQPHHADDNRWQVRREHASRASRVFDTQREAEQFGRQVAQREKVELIVAGRDGKVRDKRSFGNDRADVPG